jgi:hypothetical protein
LPMVRWMKRGWIRCSTKFATISDSLTQHGQLASRLLKGVLPPAHTTMMIAVARAVVAARKVKEVRQDHAGFGL